MAEQILRIKDDLGNTHDLAIELSTQSGVFAMRTNDPDSEKLLLDLKRGVTDYRKLIEWNASYQPVYIGLNAQSALTTDTSWTIQRITWDANGLPTDVQVLTGVWDDRSTLGWS